MPRYAYTSKQYTKGKRLDPKDNTLYDFIYLKCLERQIYRDRKHIGGCLGLEENGK